MVAAACRPSRPASSRSPDVLERGPRRSGGRATSRGHSREVGARLDHDDPLRARGAPACVCWPFTERPAKSASARRPAARSSSTFASTAARSAPSAQTKNTSMPGVPGYGQAGVRRARSAAARSRRRSRRRASACRRAPRRARRSGRRRDQRRSRAALGPDELPGRARVVVEPADERRARARSGRRMRPGTAAPRRSARGRRRRASRRSSAPGAAPPEPPAASRRCCRARAAGSAPPAPASLRPRSPACSVEPRTQALEVRGPAGLRRRSSSARGGTRRRRGCRSKRVVELDHLRVDGRVVGADRLDVELPVLAKTALLRSAVPVDRLDRVELLRLRLAVEAVLEVRPARSAPSPRRAASASGRHGR